MPTKRRCSIRTATTRNDRAQYETKTDRLRRAGCARAPVCDGGVRVSVRVGRRYRTGHGVPRALFLCARRARGAAARSGERRLVRRDADPAFSRTVPCLRRGAGRVRARACEGAFGR